MMTKMKKLACKLMAFIMLVALFAGCNLNIAQVIRLAIIIRRPLRMAII